MPAYRLHLIKCALAGLSGALVWTPMLIYQVSVVGMTPLQLVLAGTMLEITVFLCEVPTGVVADVYSRRLSSLIGFLLIGLSIVLQGLIPLFGVILLGNFLWGLGYTFTSGAYDAWLVDELGQERAPDAFLRGSQVERAASIIGILVSIGLGVIALQIPIVAGGFVMLALGLLMALRMPEQHFHPQPRGDRSTWHHLTDTFREGVGVVRSRPVLISILGIGFFFGLFSEGWDRLWQAHLLTTFNLGAGWGVPPVAIIGALGLFDMALGIGVTEIVRRRVALTRPRAVAGALLLFTVLMIVMLFAFGLAPALGVALAAYIVFVQARGQFGTIFAVWTNQHLESRVRATVLSMTGQVDAIGEIIGGPPVGLIGNFSLPAAFMVSGLLLTPAAWLLQRVRRSDPDVVLSSADDAIAEADAPPA